MSEAGEEVPVQEFSNPRTWRRNPAIWGHVEDIAAIEEILEALAGKVARDGMSDLYHDCRQFLNHTADVAREELAAAVYAECGITLPEEDPEEEVTVPRKAREDIRGTDDSTRDRDHLRG